MEPVAENDLHDWEIVSVLSEPLEQKLTLSIAFPSARSSRQRADLVFTGVLGHFLEGEVHQNVIAQLRELSVHDVVSAYAFLFRRERPFCWPCSSRDDADLEREIGERGVRAFEISSSIGLAGFVLAKSVDVRSLASSA